MCPAPLSDEQTDRMQRYAVMAHKALSCRGVSRTDFIMDGDGAMWALETNTLPGMTPTSLIPQEAAAVGVSYQQLCQRLLDLAQRERG